MHVAGEPLKKVKMMIEDLLRRPMEEADEEAECDGWCDAGFLPSEQTQKEKIKAVETLHAEIDELQASIASSAAARRPLSHQTFAVGECVFETLKKS